MSTKVPYIIYRLRPFPHVRNFYFLTEVRLSDIHIGKRESLRLTSDFIKITVVNLFTEKPVEP